MSTGTPGHRRPEDDIARDIRDHIEAETRDNIERGMSPVEARLTALRKFGNVLRIAEDTRAVWRWMPVERLLQDIHYALRGLQRNPVFATVAICTLALGIGMNTAVFSVVSAVLIKPLPYPDAGRLVWLANNYQPLKLEASAAFDFADWRAQSRSFEAIVAYGTADRTVQDGGQSAKHPFAFFTSEFWRIAGARAALGRLFTADDRGVLVLSWRMFEQRFGADPSAVGRVVSVDGRPVTIIGVLPRDFRFLPPPGVAGLIAGDLEGFTPIVISPETQARGRNLIIFFVVAKLKSGVSVETARSELQGIQTRIARENPSMHGLYDGVEVRVLPLQEKLVGASRRALLVLLAAVVFVLTIACANLGNLLLARATARQREIAIRAAIGAGRNRLLRQFLVEGLTLSLVGGAAGLALARAADALLLRLSPSAFPRIAEVGIDWRVSFFALSITLLAGAVFGIAPLLTLSTDSLYSALKDSGRASSGSAGLQLRRLLVAAELALALVLLTGAGLMVRSFYRMYTHPASFEPEQIALLKVFLSGPAYRQSPAAAAYARRVIEQLGRVPGVRAVAVETNPTGSAPVELDGPSRFAPGEAPQVYLRAVSSGYRSVAGIPLVRGRWITDDEPTPAVMVNETFVRQVFGNDEPLGRRVRADSSIATIVGVAGDVKMARLDADPQPEILVPYRQMTFFGKFDISVRTQGTPDAILPELRRVVQGIDPTQPPYGISTLEAALSASIAPRRFNLIMLGTFAASALLLALIGIYGVISYSVTQRTHEIGVRMALGARRKQIVGMVVRDGMGVALAGIAVGLAAALALTRLMSTLLFEVKPNDPMTFVAVAVSLIAAALVASWVPALKAARVDPLQALRYE